VGVRPVRVAVPVGVGLRGRVRRLGLGMCVSLRNGRLLGRSLSLRVGVRSGGSLLLLLLRDGVRVVVRPVRVPVPVGVGDRVRVHLRVGVRPVRVAVPVVVPVRLAVPVAVHVGGAREGVVRLVGCCWRSGASNAGVFFATVVYLGERQEGRGVGQSHGCSVGSQRARGALHVVDGVTRMWRRQRGADGVIETTAAAE
jgi:hypothetical protein